MNKIIEHVVADQVISCETGLTVEALNEHLSTTGQWLSASGATPHSTLLELLESGEGGPLDTGYGGPRNLILGAGLVTGGGVDIKTGGKIVKNVTGYDLTKLMIGARSWFGITHTVHLRLFAKPDEFRTFVIALENAAALNKLLKDITSSGLPVVVLDAIDSGLVSSVLESHHKQYHNIWESFTALKSASGNFCYLIASLAGRKTEVENTSKVFQSKVFETTENVLQLEGKDSLQLVESISQIEYLTGLKAISLSLPLSSGHALSNNLKAKNKPINWLARPALGMFKLFMDEESLEKIDEIKASIKNEMESDSSKLYLKSSRTISYPSKDFEQIVARDDEKISEIIQGIKQNFDHNQILNPLVKY